MSNLNNKPAAFAFVPRSLVAKQHTPKAQQAKSSSLSSIKPPHLHDNNDDDDDVVKATSAQQRWPNAEEPVCVMCGKYGEYICDETDEDVCSLACKATHLKQVGLQAKPQFDETIEKQITENKVLVFEEHFQNTLQNVRQRMCHINQQKCDIFRQKFEIKTKGVNVPLLSLGFEECGFSQQLMENLKANDYLYPTSVQMQSIPVALNYRDMLVSATTSSGKTACFLLPMVQIIQHFLASLPTIHPFRRDPLALILAPTRELCMQIEEQIKALCQGIENIKTCLLVGGNPLPQQLYRLRHQIHFVIGTPGRINDVIDNHDGSLRLRHIKMVVLDEVDVMLQMGFLNQIERILSDVPPSPQYMMFSATIPRSIERLAEQKMKNPIFVSVGQSGVTNSLVHQVILWVEDTSKRKKLFSVIREPKHFHPPMLVFVESRLGADMLSEAIQEKIGITCDSLHSDKTQTERNVILQNFLTGGYKVLVTTNVLGRGLDLHNVKQVIVFDMPKTIEDYIHQVGRAGRLHIKGVVMTFINKSNKNLFRPLQELCEKTGTKIPEELLTSSLLQSAREKEKKLKNEQAKEAKKRKWDEEDLNKKSLLDILTKKVR